MTKIKFILLFLFLFSTIEAQDIDNSSPENMIKYYWEEDEWQDIKLDAGLNNKYFKILTYDDSRLTPFFEFDFNNNGYNDLLTKKTCISCSGGDYWPFYFISYSKIIDDFIVSKGFGHSNDAKIEKWNGKMSVVMKNTTPQQMHETIDRYILENGEPKMVESIEIEKIKAIKEILVPSGTNQFEKENYSISYDLDNDGVMDEINCGLWPRWEIFTHCKISLSSGGNFEIENVGKRIGVLSTKTNGINDIVFHLNNIYIWNGKKYIKKDTIPSIK